MVIADIAGHPRRFPAFLAAAAGMAAN